MKKDSKTPKRENLMDFSEINDLNRLQKLNILRYLALKQDALNNMTNEEIEIANRIFIKRKELNDPLFVPTELSSVL